MGTATSTAATGKWTSTSGSPTPRCPTRTPLSSGPRSGNLSLITGTFTRERRWNSPPTTKHKRCRIDGKPIPAIAVQKPKPAIVEVAQAVVPEAVPEAVPDLAPEVVPEVVPEVEAVAEAAPEVAAEEVAEVAAEVVPEPPAEVTPAPEGGDQ